MTDYTLKYQVWAGEGKESKLATFRNDEAPMRIFLSVIAIYPNSYIYDANDEVYIGRG